MNTHTLTIILLGIVSVQSFALASILMTLKRGVFIVRKSKREES